VLTLAPGFDKFDGAEQYYTPAEVEANACLIAAAPDLLKALKELRSQFGFYQSGWMGYPFPNRIGLAQDLADADAAIAKAEGAA
jgi:hypothetical protein